MPDDVDPGDFLFTVIEAALSLGANEIEPTPAEEFGEVRVHFRIKSEFLAQAPLTPMQFGLLDILLIEQPADQPELAPVLGSYYILRDSYHLSTHIPQIGGILLIV